jgi:hypothetical protein
MEQLRTGGPLPSVEKLKVAAANQIPMTPEAWLPIGLALRGSFVAALLSFLSLVAAAYALWATVLLVLVDDFPEPFPAVAALAALSVQAVYSGTFSVSRTDPIELFSIETTVGLVAFPSLLTIAIMVVSVLAARRSLRSLTAHRLVAAAVLPLGFALTSITLIWALGFVTNRYAVFPLDSELFGIGSELFGLTVSSLTLGDVLAVTAVTSLPALLAGLFLLYPESVFDKVLGWFLRTLRTFFFVFLALGIATGFVYFLYSLISVDFGVSPSPSTVPDTDWAAIFIAMALILIFLPTILLNVLWIVSGAPVGVQADPATRLSLADVTPGGWFDDVVFLGESYSLWDSNPLLAGVALFVVLCIALFSGAASAKYSKFHPQSFWALAVQAGLAVLFALAIKWLTSAHYFFNTVISGNTPDDFDSSDFVSDSELLGFSFSWGIGELAVIALALGIVVSAFFGARYLTDWLPGIFPRFVSVISLGRLAAGEERTSSTAQRLTARGLLALGVLFAIGALSLATAERVFAMVDSPERYVKNIAEGLMSDSIDERKAVFAGASGVVWLPDDALPAAGHPFEDGFKVEIVGSGGGEWQPGGLTAVATIKSLSDPQVQLSFTVVADANDYPLGFQRAVFTGSPSAPIIGLTLPGVLVDAGVSDFLVAGEPVSPGQYFALPGTYELATEGRGIVSATDQTISLGGRPVDVQVEPVVALPSAIEGDLTGRLDQVLQACSDFDARGVSDCFSVAGENERAESLGGPPPVDYFDFVSSGDFEVAFLGCDEPTDNLDSAFALTRSQVCRWNVDAERIYFDTRIVRTPIYGTEDSWSFNRECTREYNSYFDYYYWVGCWQNNPVQVQTGTSSSEVRGAEIFRAIFRSEVAIEMSVTATYTDDLLQVGEATFSRR